MEKMVFHSSITQQEMGQRRKRNLGWVCALLTALRSWNLSLKLNSIQQQHLMEWNRRRRLSSRQTPNKFLVSPAPSAKCSCQNVKGVEKKKRHKDTRDKQQTVFIVEII
jgi:hypothetical protein